tara:strand:+ start:204 stop:449 length:246 start_codon:yes stop_codon:yes gene_type:complete
MVNINAFSDYIDLRGTPCPLNFIRCKLAAENLKTNESIKVDLDRGEPEETIVNGLSEAGYLVNTIFKNQDFVTILINHFDS